MNHDNKTQLKEQLTRNSTLLPIIVDPYEREGESQTHRDPFHS